MKLILVLWEADMVRGIVKYLPVLKWIVQADYIMLQEFKTRE